MKKLIMWIRLSNISAITAIMVGIIMRFFDDVIVNFTFLIILGVVSVLTYVVSEIAKFIIKKKLKNEK